MKVSLMILMSAVLMSMDVHWPTDFTKARDRAHQEHKYILLSFSGSDWCIPCIRTRKEIFSQDAFIHFADTALVLVNADFPRLRKNTLPASQALANEKLAEQYDKEGAFPLTILLDPDGKVIKEWKGFPNVSAQAFVDQIIFLEHQQ